MQYQEQAILKRRPEVLAPCGSWQSMEAAVKAGADAVYLGGKLFSARAFAENFDTEEILRAIDYCHLYGVRVYMALNTLLKDNEIAYVTDYAEPFYKAGIDGMIVQDMGAARILGASFKDLPLHASTQMSISSAYGASFLKEIGFTRIVPARELSLAEISKIKKECDIELETFVHGAMCYAYSGKCLMSSFIGSRSGNRGRCAQPCRKCWQLEGVSDTAKECGHTDARYVMSMKDMCTIEILPQLIEAGIDSFKIEGRMKKPEYVAIVTKSYRTAVDMYYSGTWDDEAISELIRDMADIYNRGAFSEGYYFRQNGREMLSDKRAGHCGVYAGCISHITPPYVYVKTAIDIHERDVLEIRTNAKTATGISESVELTSTFDCIKGRNLTLNGRGFKKLRPGMKVYRTRNNKLIDEINEEILTPEKYINVKAFVKARVGEPLTITLEFGEAAVMLSGAYVQRASSRPVTAQIVEQKMNKSKGSGVRLDVSCDIDEDAFIQMSNLNALRRDAITALKNCIAVRYRRTSDK